MNNPGLWIFHSRLSDRRVVCTFRSLDWTQEQYLAFCAEVESFGQTVQPGAPAGVPATVPVRRMTAAEFMNAPVTHAVWAQKRRTGARICLSDKCRSAGQAEQLRAMYAASSEYSAVNVRNIRRVDVAA